MDALGNVVAGLVGAAGLLALLAFPAQRYINHRFDKQSERLRAELERDAFEHQTRFGSLHNRRVKVLDKIYQRLSRAHSALQIWTRHVRGPSTSSMDEDSQRAQSAVREFIEYFQEHRIWLPDELCDELTVMAMEFRNLGLDFAAHETAKEWRAVRDRLDTEISELRKKVEARARAVIDPKLPSDVAP